MEDIVRIKKIELTNFKNVEHGKIVLSEEENTKAEIIGIYGQNGSGKTAIAEAIWFLKVFLSRSSMPANIHEYINVNSEYAKLSFDFDITTCGERYWVTYCIKIKKIAGGARIVLEQLKYCDLPKIAGSRMKTIFEYDYDENTISFGTNEKLKSVLECYATQLEIAKEFSKEWNNSYIFNDRIEDLIDKMREQNQSVWRVSHNIIKVLNKYATVDLFVQFNTVDTSMYLPLFFRTEEKLVVAGKKTIMTESGNAVFRLEEDNFVSSEQLEYINKVVSVNNKVLCKIVPGLTLLVHESGREFDKDGNTIIRTQLMSVRGNVKIPVKYESEGIKKIISMLSILIFIYNKPSACFVVDEFDSGVFEYLLGELLEILQEGGKGQLIFTSHNLRPLELIDKKELYFTTTNPRKRYIHLTNVRPSNNMRDVYLRAINLGGQSEEIYESTDSLEVSRAFRNVGDFIE